MIPIKIELYNFLAYCEPDPLQLDGLHVVCLSGDNGAGKSALLDAMTWALWGRARSKSDDELIHHGRNEMRVAFTFQLGSQVYRVTRQRQAGKITRSGNKAAGHTLLDLQVQHNGDWHTLGEGHVHQTQSKITELLRLDYETFIHSAFLMQGRADSFTLKPPTERKVVLADILGLEQWDAYDRRAKERLDAVKEQLNHITFQIGEIEKELAQRDDIEKQLIEAQAEAIRLGDELKQADAAERDIALQRQALEGLQHQQDDLNRRLRELEGDLTRLQGQLAESRTRLEQDERLIADREAIEQGYARLVELWKQDDELRERERSYNEMDKSRLTLEAAIRRAAERLETQIEGWIKELAKEEKRAAMNGLLKQLDDVQAEIVRLDEVKAQCETAQAEVGDLNTAYAELFALNEALHKEIDPLAEKVELLERGEGEAKCPLCGQPLDAQHRDELLEQLHAEGKEKADRYRDNKARLAEMEKRKRELSDTIATLIRELKRRDPTQQRLAALQQQQKDAQGARVQVGTLQAEIASAQETLKQHSFALDERRQLVALEQNMEALGYDAAQHQQVRLDFDQHKPFQQRKSDLDKAAERVEAERRHVAQLDEQCGRQSAAVNAEREKAAELQAQAQALHALLRDADGIWQRADELRRSEHEARLRVDRAQQRLATLDYQEKQREASEADRTKLEQERAIYEELRLAFGKKGIPAMIIEAAIPEIEKTANELLSRMTNGRMHVRFDTQRDNVKGETVETLDIKISDELGTRDYHMYSGGEGFRVNFAIRVALSQLLARRAGAQLQTLVVDEGFGALDATGREQLVEAINAVQRDFARVIVVTHIEELKDAFPARINVVKTAGGSRLSVS
jgi:exonuclease SbcC